MIGPTSIGEGDGTAPPLSLAAPAAHVAASLLREFVERLPALSGCDRVVAALELPGVPAPLVAAAGPGPAADQEVLPLQAAMRRLRPGQDPTMLRVGEGDALAVPVQVQGAGRGVLVFRGVDLPGRSGEIAPVAASAAAALGAIMEGVGRRELEEPSAVAAVAALVAAGSPPGRVLNEVARRIVFVTGAARCTVHTLDPSGALVPAAVASRRGDAELTWWRVFDDLGGMPALRQAMSTGRSNLVADPSTDPGFLVERWPEGLGSGPVAVVPAGRPGQAVLFIEAGDVPLSGRDVHIAELLASLGAASITVATAIDRAERAARRSRLVAGTLSQLSAQPGTGGVVLAASAALRELLGDEAVVTWIPEGAVFATGDEVISGEAVHTFNRDPAAVERIVAGDAGVRVVEVADGIPGLFAVGVRRALRVVLRRGSRRLGWMLSLGNDARPYPEEARRAVGSLVGPISLSLHNARLLEVERSAVNRLEELGRARSGFVASVSHELRTPLTAIVGFSELLSEWISDEEASRYLEEVRREANVLEGMVANLLDAGRLETGELHLRREPVDLAAIAAEAVAVVRHGYPDCAYRLGGDAPVLVEADPRRMRQVLVNLVENGAKYGGARGVVEVVVSAAPAEATVSVTDRGPGIPEAERARVFDRFVRLRGTAGLPGTGIGLYLVRELVEAHGGRVTVEDGAEGGARFVVGIPVA